MPEKKKSDEIARWLSNAHLFIPGETIHRYAVLDDDIDEVRAPLDEKSVFICHYESGTRPTSDGISTSSYQIYTPRNSANNPVNTALKAFFGHLLPTR